MKPFVFDYPWTDRKEWFLPDGEEMMQNQFPILDEQIDMVLGAIEVSRNMDDTNVHFRTCVQAGGAFGLYPLRLSHYFDKVWTFEPLLANLQCMSENIAKDTPNITICANALWWRAETLQMKYPKKVKNSYGAHHVSKIDSLAGDDFESTSGFPLDDWTLQDVDLIWLDIEGAEVFALNGALNTIDRCRPVVVIEDRHLPQMSSMGVTPGAAPTFLRDRGYQYFDRTHGDTIWIPEKV